MSNSWDDTTHLSEKHINVSGGLFIKLANDGDKVVGAFVGNPYGQEVHWNGKKYVPCTENGCSLCKEGKKASFRAALNFYVPGEKGLKVIQGGNLWFQDLLKVREKYGLENWLFEIERHGEAGSNKTTYTILPEEKLSAAQHEEIAGLKQNDLRRLFSGESESDNFDSYDDTTSTQAIDAETADTLKARLKALPRTAVDAFLDKLRVKKISDVKASDETIALSFLDHLESQHGQPQQNTEEEHDPFA